MYTSQRDYNDYYDRYDHDGYTQEESGVSTGYDNGYHDGYTQGASNASTGYDNGYYGGYTQGENNAYTDYDDGYHDGYVQDDGYTSYNRGRNDRRSRQRESSTYRRGDMRRIMISWIVTGAFCLVFSLVYSIFSHGVSSPYMTWLCLFPFLAGAVPPLLLSVRGFLSLPGQAEVNLYNTGVAALTLSSAMRGIFEIAGTGSVYQVWMMIAGAVLCVIGILVYILRTVGTRRRMKAYY